MFSRGFVIKNTCAYNPSAAAESVSHSSKQSGALQEDVRIECLEHEHFVRLSAFDIL